jgi:MYND finger/Sel1 repeat
MNCMRCKSVAYCSAECQRLDWKDHKPTCQRREFAGAPCDFCGSTEDVQGGHICLHCGALSCKVCGEREHNLTRDQSSGQGLVSIEQCQRCNKGRVPVRFRDHKKLEKLIKESPRDPRLPNWLVRLGDLLVGKLVGFDDETETTRRGEKKAKEHYLRAGELGYGAGFSRTAEIYIKNRKWDEARQFYRMAAAKFHPHALHTLAADAALGYLVFDQNIQEDDRRTPDLEEAFRLYREGARLGYAKCCSRLGDCYHEGKGTEVNMAKAFKWYKVAADKGDALGMFRCAECYQYGEGTEQSDEQAFYWYEKNFELSDSERFPGLDELARDNLQTLRGRIIGSSF